MVSRQDLIPYLEKIRPLADMLSAEERSKLEQVYSTLKTMPRADLANPAKIMQRLHANLDDEIGRRLLQRLNNLPRKPKR